MASFLGLVRDHHGGRKVTRLEYSAYAPMAEAECARIVSEAEAKAMKPDYFLVLPWHFKDGILRREKEYLASGGKFIFPFPEIEIV